MNAKFYQVLPPPIDTFHLASTALVQVVTERKSDALPGFRVAPGLKRAVRMMAKRQGGSTLTSYVRGAILFRILTDIHMDSRGDERVLMQLLDNFHCPACRVVRHGLFHKKRGS